MGAVFRGIWSGLFATSTMTMSMFKFYKMFPGIQREPLPPATLTKSVMKKTGVDADLPTGLQMEASMVSHAAFGAGFGVLYALLAPRVPGNPVVKGACFGLGVWGASYLGWIPAMNLQPQAKTLNRQQNMMMFLSHIVWGASLGYNEKELRQSGQKMLRHSQTASARPS